MTAERVAESVWRWLAAAVIAAAAPHFLHLPLWVSGILVGAVGLRLALRRPPPRWLLIVLVFAAFIGVLVQFRSISGPDAGTSFLTAMVALKFLESRTNRDAGLLICLAYFLATAAVLFSEAIATAVYVGASIWLTTAALVTLAHPGVPAPRVRLRVAGSLLAQAVPIMVVLFLLFPRIPGPLWSMNDEQTAATGLSDSMSPGNVTELARSFEVAFRVEFEDQVPAQEQLYWRGPVFDQYDGEQWREADVSWDEQPALARERDRIEYILTLEEHQQRWLFALDMPGNRTPANSDLNRHRQLRTDNPVRSTQRFELESYLDYQLQPELASAQRRLNLSLPDDTAPQARDLAEELRADAGANDAAFVEAALNWFEQGDFNYTLTPSALSGDPVDDFLFDTRSGFCEHFASSYAVLMRAGGVPARIVTGYLGMEAAGAGNYYIVRQAQAHAWVEVWLADQGWIRVDPTTTVAPGRIDMGLESIDQVEQMVPQVGRDRDSLLYRAGQLWDGVNHAWDRFVLGYGPDLQKRLLERIGLEDAGRYALAVLSAAALALSLAALFVLAHRRPTPRDGIERAWWRVERRLARHGYRRGRGEGVHAFLHRVAAERPDLRGPLTELADLYDRLRYQAGAGGLLRRRFLKATRQFRVRNGS